MHTIMANFFNPKSFVFKIFCLTAVAEGFNINNNPKTVPSEFSKISRAPPTYSVCNNGNNIPYKSACESIISSLKASKSSLPSNPKELFDHFVHFSFNHARSSLDLASIVGLSHHQSAGNYSNINDCIELLDDSLDQLSNVINRKNNPTHTHSDVQTWLSAALTNQQTCLESLQNNNNKFRRDIMVSLARNLSQYLSNSLSLYVSHHMTKSGSGGRKLLSENGFPGWVSASERKLLEAPVSQIGVHAVVAKDGSGTHKSIGEAIRTVAVAAAAADLDGGEGGGRNVIYVKAGTYHENIKISTKQKNVMLVGDGKDKTVIEGSRNGDDGWSTFETATVGVMGDGFMAKGITFVNSAGPNKNQAVALRVGSDKSVIYQCSIQGYQDTLYTLSKRQFYRDSDIYGTVDFIFGNSAVVFQNCNIFARKYGEKNFITAQGRTDPNQNTGISIHNCKISGTSDTYLGRPWKKNSRTVIMQSFMDGSINPAGWSPWSGSFALNTLYYAEYMNSGPGASISGRVKWAGYHGELTAAAAQAFTVGSFIDGNMWLPATGVSFDSGLIG